MGSKKGYYFNYILARSEELKYSNLFVNYFLFQDVYNDAKKKMLGKFISKAKPKKQSPEMLKLQYQFRLALENVYLYKTYSFVEYAKICERNLYMRSSMEQCEKYSIW